MSIYITIGNSDDKLTQAEWSKFFHDVRCELISAGAEFHGSWASGATDAWQNAAFCVEVKDVVRDELRANLARIATKWRQDSIAWADAPTVDFLGGA